MNSSLNFTMLENVSSMPEARNYCASNMMDLNDILLHLRPNITPVDRYFSFFWFTIGFPGNLISFLVWIRRKMRPSSGCYLAALAFNDFLFLLFYVFVDLNNAWEKRILNFPGLCEMIPVFFLTTQHLSPFFVLAFTVERYISICHPYNRDKYCTTKKAVIAITCFIVFTLLVQSCQAYFWQYNDEFGICTIPEHVLKSRFWEAFNWITEIQAFVVVPTLITIINVRVIVEIKRVNKRTVLYTARNSSSGTNSVSNNNFQAGSSSSSQSATTVMLLLVSFFYIISTLPVAICYAAIPQLYSCLTFDEIKEDPEWQSLLNYWNVRIVLQELGMSHYACNILIYLLTGSQFRAEVKKLLIKCFCGENFERCVNKKSGKIMGYSIRNKSSHPYDSFCSASNSRLNQHAIYRPSYSGAESAEPVSNVVELNPLKDSHNKLGNELTVK